MTKPLSLSRSKRRPKQRRPLYRASARRLIKELSVINEIGQAISSQVRLADVLETIYRQTSRLMDTRHFYIALYHRDDDLIDFAFVMNDGERASWPPRRWSAGFTEWLIWHRRPLRRNTNDLDPDIAPIRFGMQSLSYLGVPIILGDMVLGVLSVQSVDRYDAYSARDEHILMMIADQAAVAIANAQRYAAINQALEQRIAQLEALEATARDLNATLDLDVILQRLVQRACTATGADAGMVCLLIDDRQALLVRAMIGYPPAVDQYYHEGFPITRGLAGKVARTRSAELTPDVQVSPEYVASRPSSRSQMTLPISQGDDFLGILVLESDRRNAFSHDLLRFVSQMADHAALSIVNARIHQHALWQQQTLEQQSHQLREVLRISQALSANLELDVLLPEIVQAIRTSLGFNIALLSLVDADDPTMMRRRAAVGIPEPQWALMATQLVPISWYESVMREAFRMSRSYFIPHNHDDHAQIWQASDDIYRPDLGERDEGEWHPDDALFVPLYDSAGALISVLAVDDPQDRRVPSLRSVQVLEIFANQAAIAIENAHLYATTHQAAITDGLTGLYNQAHFASLLVREIQFAQRYDYPLALLALDLDHFKDYNDTYGHLEGNSLLREFALLLRARVRDTDLVARNGGEEFAIVLPKTDLLGAQQLAERLRSAVELQPFPNRHVTVSIGVAVLAPSLDAHALQQLADDALYEAKHSGRNCVRTRS